MRTKHWKRIARGRCPGAAADRWVERARTVREAGGSDGAGHLRAAYDLLTWCVRCGAYAVSWAKGLAAPCKGRPVNPSQARVRNRLCCARHPRTNVALTGTLVIEAAAAWSTIEETRSREEERRKRCGGHSVTPRSTAGYLRRPGGAGAAFGGAAAAAGYGTEEGSPGSNFTNKKRRNLVTRSDHRLPPDEFRQVQERKRKRLEEEEGKIQRSAKRMALAIEEGARRWGQGDSSQLTHGSGTMPEQGNSQGTTRKELLRSLRGLNELRRRNNAARQRCEAESTSRQQMPCNTETLQQNPP